MKEYILKNEEDEVLMSGVFESEKLAWNIMCARTVNRVTSNEWLFLYDSSGKLIHAGKSFEVWGKNDLIEYKLVIKPDIYNKKQSFNKDVSIEQVWEEMRLEALEYEDVNFYARLYRDDGILLIQRLLKTSLLKELPQPKQQIKEQEDLLTSISKIKI